MASKGFKLTENALNLDEDTSVDFSQVVSNHDVIISGTLITVI